MFFIIMYHEATRSQWESCIIKKFDWEESIEKMGWDVTSKSNEHSNEFDMICTGYRWAQQSTAIPIVCCSKKTKKKKVSKRFLVCFIYTAFVQKSLLKNMKSVRMSSRRTFRFQVHEFRLVCVMRKYDQNI